MTRIIVVVGVVLTAGATRVYADELPTDETIAVAEEAGVDALDLQGAVNETGIAPREYLYQTGELARPEPVRPAVVAYPAPTGRVACIESKESKGRNIPNLQGSGAGGVMQYMEPTFRAHANAMATALHDPSIRSWSRWVPWQARALAAWDLAHGLRGQWTVAGC